MQDVGVKESHWEREKKRTALGKGTLVKHPNKGVRGKRRVPVTTTRSEKTRKNRKERGAARENSLSPPSEFNDEG